MTEINGPYITKDIVVPEHIERVLDEDAYWHLDWTGAEDPEGPFLFARVAYPRLTDAQRQHALKRFEVEQHHRNTRTRRRSRKALS